MNRFRNLLTCSICALAAALPLGSQAQSPAPAAPAASAAPLAEGEVRRIDKEGGKVTIKHGVIQSLDMPPMTMVFTAQDKALLAPLQVGDKIRFSVVNEGGKYLVTQIQPMP